MSAINAIFPSDTSSVNDLCGLPTKPLDINNHVVPVTNKSFNTSSNTCSNNDDITDANLSDNFNNVSVPLDSKFEKNKDVLPVNDSDGNTDNELGIDLVNGLSNVHKTKEDQNTASISNSIEINSENNCNADVSDVILNNEKLSNCETGKSENTNIPAISDGKCVDKLNSLDSKNTITINRMVPDNEKLSNRITCNNISSNLSKMSVFDNLKETKFYNRKEKNNEKFDQTYNNLLHKSMNKENNMLTYSLDESGNNKNNELQKISAISNSIAENINLEKQNKLSIISSNQLISDHIELVVKETLAESKRNDLKQNDHHVLDVEMTLVSETNNDNLENINKRKKCDDSEIVSPNYSEEFDSHLQEKRVKFNDDVINHIFQKTNRSRSILQNPDKQKKKINNTARKHTISSSKFIKIVEQPLEKPLHTILKPVKTLEYNNYDSYKVSENSSKNNLEVVNQNNICVNPSVELNQDSLCINNSSSEINQNNINVQTSNEINQNNVNDEISKKRNIHTVDTKTSAEINKDNLFNAQNSIEIHQNNINETTVTEIFKKSDRILPNSISTVSTGLNSNKILENDHAVQEQSTVNEQNDNLTEGLESRLTNDQNLLQCETNQVILNTDVLSEDSIKSIFQNQTKSITKRQLEEIVIQKCCEMIADNSVIGELKKQIIDLQQGEFYRKRRILQLEKQLYQLKTVCSQYIKEIEKAKEDKKIACPVRITRSVGLQADSNNITFASSSIDNSSGNSSSLNSGFISSQSTSFNTKFNNAKSSLNNSNSRNSLLNNSVSNSDISATDRNNSAYSGTSINDNSDKNTAIIDLTDKDDKNEIVSGASSRNTINTVANNSSTKSKVQTSAHGAPAQGNAHQLSSRNNSEHPLPLPAPLLKNNKPGLKPIPPKPILKVTKLGKSVTLSWTMPPVPHANVVKYQLFAYQESNSTRTNTNPWKLVGNVDALPLPMACTLTQFFEGYNYHFAVRAVDEYEREGIFSSAESILL